MDRHPASSAFDRRTIGLTLVLGLFAAGPVGAQSADARTVEAGDSAILSLIESGAIDVWSDAPVVLQQPARVRHELGAVVNPQPGDGGPPRIMAITPGGAAERMQLSVGDRLLAVNGTAAGAISLISNTLMPDGITRCVVIGFTPTASESHSFGIGPFSTTNGVNIVVLANQVEAGTDATSYIPTGASVVTRAADALTTTYAAGDYDVTATAVGGAVETLTGVTLASGEWPPITTRFLKAITITAVAAAWIMSAGSWNDSAQWDDTGLWKDSA